MEERGEGSRWPILSIVGATATGKSALAMELAERLGGEIVNADALQVYRGLDIGTAKPSPAERARVPHHLLDLLDPREPFSAGQFARRADAVLADLRARGKAALVVGGSGLYQRALFEGLATLPPVDRTLRAELQREVRESGAPRLHEELARVDPPTAARLAPGDAQRVVRALEIYRSSGQRMSDWLRDQPGGSRYRYLRFGLTLPRSVLYDRIEFRVMDMAERGWVEEVAGLLASGVPPSAPAFQAIGYRQLVGYLQGQTTLEAALSGVVASTRRYAKRQETWFRNEKGVRWLDAAGERLVDEVLRQLPPSWR